MLHLISSIYNGVIQGHVNRLNHVQCVCPPISLSHTPLLCITLPHCFLSLSLSLALAPCPLCTLALLLSFPLLFCFFCTKRMSFSNAVALKKLKLENRIVALLYIFPKEREKNKGQQLVEINEVKLAMKPEGNQGEQVGQKGDKQFSPARDQEQPSE